MVKDIPRHLRIALMLLLLAGCRPTPTLPMEVTVAPTQTEIPPPSETSTPLAAMINREPITLEEFQAELARLQDARGTDLATDNSSSEVVLQALIDRVFLAQGARQSGLELGEEDIEAEFERLAVEMGGVDNLQNWIQENNYTETTFKQSLEIEMYATEMIERILSEVPEIELQAHARHILVATQEEATAIQEQLVAGADFGELAALHSLDLSTRPGGGDLGWFATGTLTAPAVEEMIFGQQPGATTSIVESEFGYHIVQLIALEERELPYETLLARQEQAVENWLMKQMEDAEIEIFIEL